MPSGATCDIEVSGEEGLLHFESKDVSRGEDGILRARVRWEKPRRWDIHTPGNRYSCKMRMHVADGGDIAEVPKFAFGLRDVRIEGRNLLLNGLPVHLRAQNVKIARIPELWSKPVAEKILKRMRDVGFNTAVMDNYSAPEGLELHPEGMFQAADEMGFLVVCSLPNVKDFDLKGMVDADVRDRYRQAAKRMIRQARNHPSVILYSMNHNVCGYVGAQNPNRMDGAYELTSPKETSSRAKLRQSAIVAEAIVRAIDPMREVYHHESGNLGAWHTCNTYLDWAPRQERSDWLSGWSVSGVKPLFLVEWGFPHIANWSSLRGPLHIWGGLAFQSLWAAEYAAQIRGDAAYEDTQVAHEALCREEELWRTGKPFRFNQVCDILRRWESNYVDIAAHYAVDNWRAMRAWGLTAIVPWDREALHRRTGGAVSNVPQCFEDASDATYELTSLGRAFVRWNQDDCAFVGGDPVFTDRQRNYRPGEVLRKTLIILNDRRWTQQVKWFARIVDGSNSVIWSNKGRVTVGPGERKDAHLASCLSEKTGDFTLQAGFEFASGIRQVDTFAFSVLKPSSPDERVRPLLYDPKGLTAREFKRLGLPFENAGLQELVGRDRIAVIGRESLTRQIYDEVVVPLADRGGRVLVFEQDKATLEAIGFRVQELGLRTVFPRQASSAVGPLESSRLEDWAGESTLLSTRSRIDPGAEVCAPHTTWAGFRATRVWRCGNRQSVASVLPEKPANGDWRPLCDGAFGLEYSPLMEHAQGSGRVVFCQLDVTGRTVADPAADEILMRLVRSLNIRESDRGPTVKAVGSRAVRLAQTFGWETDPDFYSKGKGLWLITSGSERPADWAERIAEGGKALLVGLSADEVRAWSPVPVDVRGRSGILPSRICEMPPELSGLSAADCFWHGSLDFAAFDGKNPSGNSAVRIVRHGHGTCAFVQIAPDMMRTDERPWHRVSARALHRLLARLAANLGFVSRESHARYLDLPVPDDDPYRYFHW